MCATPIDQSISNLKKDSRDSSDIVSESQSQTFIDQNETINGDVSISRHHLMNKIIQNFDPQMSKHESQMRKKHVRRCAKELKKDFPCLYNCGKEYATDAARNMHMREKHNEVTKTERDRKARDIIRTCGLKTNSEIITKLS
jgi:hypothetical protein